MILLQPTSTWTDNPALRRNGLLHQSERAVIRTSVQPGHQCLGPDAIADYHTVASAKRPNVPAD